MGNPTLNFPYVHDPEIFIDFKSILADSFLHLLEQIHPWEAQLFGKIFLWTILPHVYLRIFEVLATWTLISRGYR